MFKMGTSLPAWDTAVVHFNVLLHIQHDSALARMLFSILYEAVFVQVDTMLTDREAEETKKAIRDGLNMVMEKSVQFHPPFIGSLQVCTALLLLSCFSLLHAGKWGLILWEWCPGNDGDLVFLFS